MILEESASEHAAVVITAGSTHIRNIVSIQPYWTWVYKFILKNGCWNTLLKFIFIIFFYLSNVEEREKRDCYRFTIIFGRGNRSDFFPFFFAFKWIHSCLKRLCACYSVEFDWRVGKKNIVLHAVSLQASWRTTTNCENKMFHLLLRYAPHICLYASMPQAFLHTWMILFNVIFFVRLWQKIQLEVIS